MSNISLKSFMRSPSNSKKQSQSPFRHSRLVYKLRGGASALNLEEHPPLAPLMQAIDEPNVLQQRSSLMERVRSHF